MNKSRFLMSLLFAVVAVFAAAQAEDPALRKEMQHLYAKWDAFVAKKDLSGLMTMVDKSYVSVDTEGKKMNYAQSKAQLKGFFSTLRDIKSQTSVKNVKHQGPEATVWAEMVLTFKMQQGGKWVAQKFTMRFADTLKNTANGWKFTYSQELPTNEPWDFGG